MQLDVKFCCKNKRKKRRKKERGTHFGPSSRLSRSGAPRFISRVAAPVAATAAAPAGVDVVVVVVVFCS